MSFAIPNEIMDLCNYQHGYKTITEKLWGNFIMDTSCWHHLAPPCFHEGIILIGNRNNPQNKQVKYIIF